MLALFDFLLGIAQLTTQLYELRPQGSFASAIGL